MEPIPSTSTLIDPASIPSASPRPDVPAVPDRASATEPLPKLVVWAAVIVAAAIPATLLITLLMCVWSENFSFFTWME
jgi:hypothetical protein